MNKFLAVLIVLTLAGFSVPARAGTADGFAIWLSNVKTEALNHGISQQTVHDALDNIQYVPRAIELDQKQPEHKITFTQYKKNVVNAQRIKRGRELIRQHARDLYAIEKVYGVAPQYVVALWGIETNFGTNTGGFQVIPALATMAWEGRRAEFFKSELLKALQIIDQGHITADRMKGSWAGAMGQNQFMPSSFLNFAVDGNGDGHKDIWNTEIDVFASTANYLHKSGWTDGQRWGRRVTLPHGFKAELATPKITHSLTYWASIGVKDYGGGSLPSDSMPASVVAPDGVGGEAYIVYSNYQTIMKWNRSTYFATSVGLLADALAR